MTELARLCSILRVQVPDSCAGTVGGSTLSGAWACCTDGSWMMGVAGHLSGPAGCDGRRTLVLAACDCAESSDTARMRLLDSAHRWGMGDKAVTIEQIRAAATALDTYRACAFGDTGAAVCAAAYSASARATAATLAACADIARRHFPDLVMLMLTSDNAKCRLLAIQSMEVAA